MPRVNDGTARAAEADRDPPRGHRDAAGADGAGPRAAAPLHPVLRRPLLRRRRHLLQVAEGGAGGRHRGAAGERRVLRHLQPPPSAAARHDGERALDRDQSASKRWRRRCRCRTASACGSASTIAARTNISRWSAAMSRHYRLTIAEERAAGRGPGMGDHPRRPLRPRRLAVRPGSGGAAWGRPCG